MSSAGAQDRYVLETQAILTGAQGHLVLPGMEAPPPPLCDTVCSSLLHGGRDEKLTDEGVLARQLQPHPRPCG